MSWVKTKDGRPEPGALIVKRWLPSGSVWAGIYSGTDKDSSFDEWYALPAAGVKACPSMEECAHGSPLYCMKNGCRNAGVAEVPAPLTDLEIDHLRGEYQSGRIGTFVELVRTIEARTRGVAPVSDAEAAQSVLTDRTIPEIQADIAATMRKIDDAARSLLDALKD